MPIRKVHIPKKFDAALRMQRAYQSHAVLRLWRVLVPLFRLLGLPVERRTDGNQLKAQWLYRCSLMAKIWIWPLRIAAIIVGLDTVVTTWHQSTAIAILNKTANSLGRGIETTRQGWNRLRPLEANGVLCWWPQFVSSNKSGPKRRIEETNNKWRNMQYAPRHDPRPTRSFPNNPTT